MYRELEITFRVCAEGGEKNRLFRFTVGSLGHEINISHFSMITFLSPVQSISVKRANMAFRTASL